MQPSATIDHLLAERLRRGAGAREHPHPASIGPADLRALTAASLADDLPAGQALCLDLQSRGASIRDILTSSVRTRSLILRTPSMSTRRRRSCWCRCPARSTRWAW